MDPVSLILTALTAGASASIQATASEAVKDLYDGLKALIQQRFVGRPKAQMILAEHEKKPDIWKAPLVEELRETGSDQDEEIIEVAQKLMSQLDPQQAAIGKYNIQVSGNAQMQRFVIGDSNTTTFQDF